MSHQGRTQKISRKRAKNKKVFTEFTADIFYSFPVPHKRFEHTLEWILSIECCRPSLDSEMFQHSSSGGRPSDFSGRIHLLQLFSNYFKHESYI